MNHKYVLLFCFFLAGICASLAQKSISFKDLHQPLDGVVVWCREFNVLDRSVLTKKADILKQTNIFPAGFSYQVLGPIPLRYKQECVSLQINPRTCKTCTWIWIDKDKNGLMNPMRELFLHTNGTNVSTPQQAGLPPSPKTINCK
ncbi:MAG: hypothetical protein AAF587_29395 [Bacteroidota bacterium]